MILTVTLNTVLDRVVEIPNFKPGKVNRIKRERARIAGGKGVNVSRVVKSLGEDTLCTGWLGGIVGEEIKRRLEEEGIPQDFVSIKGESRVNWTILSCLDERKQTHLVDVGPKVSTQEVKSLKEKLVKLVKKSAVVVFSGSVPPGGGERIYYSLLNLVHREKENIISILDTAGVYLREGIRAQPFMIKPNREELEELKGEKLISQNILLKEAYSLIRGGISLVVISQGKREVIVVSKKRALIFSPPFINPLNTVGAGDALVGGFAVGFKRGMDIVRTSCLGVACGIVSAEKGRETPFIPSRITDLSNQIRVKEVTIKDI